MNRTNVLIWMLLLSFFVIWPPVLYYMPISVTEGQIAVKVGLSIVWIATGIIGVLVQLRD